MSAGNRTKSATINGRTSQPHQARSRLNAQATSAGIPRHRELQRIGNRRVEKFGGDDGAGRNRGGEQQAIVGRMKQGRGDKWHGSRQQKQKEKIADLINRFRQDVQAGGELPEKAKANCNCAKQRQSQRAQAERDHGMPPPGFPRGVYSSLQANFHQQQEHHLFSIPEFARQGFVWDRPANTRRESLSLLAANAHQRCNFRVSRRVARILALLWGEEQ